MVLLSKHGCKMYYSLFATLSLIHKQTSKDFVTTFFFASSRVSRTSRLLSHPRKELNALVLLVAELVKMATELNVPRANLFIHVDSKIVIAWTKQQLGQQTVYVKNRIAKI